MTPDLPAPARDQHPFAVRNRNVWAIAIPASIAFVTEPVAGIVDTAVIGRLGDAGLLGGLALGTTVFSVLFALAFFLRFGTAGLTAQAVGAKDPHEGVLHLARALMVALGLGLALLALSWPLHALSAAALAPPPPAQQAFADYVFMRMVSVPFVLVNFALLGWFYGRADARTGMVLQIGVNVINIALSVFLVFRLGWGVVGVALGTVAGQIAAALAGLFLAIRHYGGVGRIRALVTRAALFDLMALRRMVSLSRDLIIRSLALISAFAYFSSQGARMGEVGLAANAILMQFFAVSAFFLDGLATAVEQLCGRAIGANWQPAFDRARTLGLAWGLAVAATLSVILLVGGAFAIDLMTTSTPVREAARTLLVFVALTPLTGMPAWVYDGVMIGATLNTIMRNGMLISLAAFLVVALALKPVMGIAGLWLALHVLMIVRALIYAWAIVRIKSRLFTPPRHTEAEAAAA